MPLLARMRESIWSLVSPSASVHKKTSRDAIDKKKTPSKSTRKPPLLSPPWTGDDDSTLIATSPASPTKKMDSAYTESDIGASGSVDDEQTTDAPHNQMVSDSDDLDDASLDQNRGVVEDWSNAPTSPSNQAKATLVKERDLVERGWQQDEISLFFELDLRGLKPLFPRNWYEWDLNTFPLDLFAHEAQEKDFFMIKPYKDTEFRATRAICSLTDLGPNVRDTRDSGGIPERTLARGVRAFWKWALRDARLEADEDVPNLLIHSGSKKTPTAQMKAAMQNSAEKLIGRFERLLEADGDEAKDQNPNGGKPRSIPTIYGLIASSTAFMIVSYSAYRQGDELHTIGIYDFKQMSQDVWNSIAIMCLIVHCRDKLVQFYNPPQADPASDHSDHSGPDGDMDVEFA